MGRNLGDAPRLKNRAAPGTTIITHCVNHRGNKPTDPGAKDFVARLDGDVDVMQLGNFADPDGTGLKVSTWISQLK